MTIIGIDPGKSGGIAWHDGTVMQVAKTPETLPDLWELIRHISMGGDTSNPFRAPCHAFIEFVHSSPQMGVVSAFSFGNGYGHLEMALVCAEIPFERVRPQKWQKDLQCLTKGDKNVSKARAQELFPHLKLTHATADACLICEYGRRISNQTNNQP